MPINRSGVIEKSPNNIKIGRERAVKLFVAVYELINARTANNITSEVIESKTNKCSTIYAAKSAVKTILVHISCTRDNAKKEAIKIKRYKRSPTIPIVEPKSKI